MLLGGVALGYFYAVEAAAIGAFVLLAPAGCSPGACAARVLRDVLHDAMATTGALFALLIAATTLTLVLRLLGTDRLVDRPGSRHSRAAIFTVVAIVLGVIGLSAFVLDAFEIIFVIVPIVIPPLLIRVADARWVAVLVLLTLQSSFLLPPFGYALMMVRGTLVPAPFRAVRAGARAVPDRAMARCSLGAAGPASWCISARTPPTPPGAAKPVSTDEINRRLEDMMPPMPDLDAPKMTPA